MEQVFPLSPIAIYLHNPFCLRLCPYCSFYRIGYNQKLQTEYLQVLMAELKLWKDRFGGQIKAKSVYFGGGSPALITIEGINNLLQEMQIESGAEITLELNPIQITPKMIKQLKCSRINRISLGVQSFDDEMLMLLGRSHRSADIAGKIKALRDVGYDNISLDLIYGLPLQSLDMLENDLEELLQHAPEHISTYLLTLDNDSPMAVDIARGKIPEVADEFLAADMYELIRKKLGDAGYLQYEISNFALSGYEGKHNLSYWHNEPYLAIGASASSWIPPWRFSNPASLHKHQENIQNQLLMPDKEQRQGKDEEDDYLMMGLRLIQGISRAKFLLYFGHDLYENRQKAIDKLIKLGMLKMDESWLRLSEEALFISNSVIGELL